MNFVLAHPRARKIDPGQIGRFNLHGLHTGNFADTSFKKFPVAIQILHHRIDPGIAMPKGGFGHQGAIKRGLRAVGGIDGPELPAQFWVGNNRAAKFGPGNVEGLAGRNQRDQPVGNIGGGIADGCMRMAGENKVAMNFIADQNQVMFHAEIGHLPQFLNAPDTPAGVMGGTPCQNTLAPAHPAFECVHIEQIAPALILHGNLHNFTAIGAGHGRKGMVEGRELDDTFARLGIGLHAMRKGVHQSSAVDHPIGF